MKIDDHKYKLIVVVIAGVLVGVVVKMCSFYKNKRKKLQPPEPVQTPQWQRHIDSAPTYQPRNVIDVENDRFVKKYIVPLRPYAERLRGKIDDGGFMVMTAASTSAFGVGCGGSSGGDSGCSGGHNGTGGGCGGGGGGGCGGS